MEAYRSTRMLSLTPKSAPANQPEAEIQDLSVTDDSATVSLSQSKEDGSIYRDHRSFTQKRRYETQEISLANTNGGRSYDAQQSQPDEYKVIQDNRDVSMYPDPSESLKTIGFDVSETTDASHPIVVRDSSPPQPTKRKKRHLPDTIMKDR